MSTTGIEAGPDRKAIEARQQRRWATGRCSRIGSRLQVCGENLVEAMDARPGASFLDVGAGAGNLSLAAARRFLRVVSTDYVLPALQDGRARAEAEGLDVTFEVADAEALRFEDDRFDFVGSAFGVMYAPDPRRAAAELARVSRPGGRIGLASWTPDGFMGRRHSLMERFDPAPAGLPSPTAWGTEAFLREAFEGTARDLRARRRTYSFRYESAEHFLEEFRSHDGPTISVFPSLGRRDRSRLQADLRELLEAWNVAVDGTLSVPAEYLEVVITSRGG